ncbi:flagellar FliJ family protein [Leifsonia sp. YAF41]|uniref:flagellar FliJ family protein n=1 Tax=Leifsonia sp. YAF41 TaxID=3233086 RepID=UPI003F9BCCDB
MAFSLAGLLRLRHLEEDEAGQTLARANSRLEENSAREAQIRRKLGGGDDEAASVEVLRAVAAARASSRSMLAELEAVARVQRQEADEARAAFAAARTRSKGLERLEEKHNLAVAVGELRTEQNALDEIASGARARSREGAS